MLLTARRAAALATLAVMCEERINLAQEQAVASLSVEIRKCEALHASDKAAWEEERAILAAMQQVLTPPWWLHPASIAAMSAIVTAGTYWGISQAVR